MTMKCQQALAWRGAGLCRRGAAVDDQFGAGYEGGFVGCQVDGAVGNFAGLAHPAQGQALHSQSHTVRVVEGVGNHIGFNGAGVNGVAADALAGVLDGGGFGEQADGALGGGVAGGAVGAAHQPGGGGYVDDAAAAAGAQGGDGRLGAQKDALGVDGKDAVPVGFGGVLNVFADEDARVVEQDVQLAIGGDGGLDGGVPVGFAGDIQVDVGAFVAEFAELGFGLAAGVVQDVADDHFGAFLGEHSGFHSALAARAAADEGNLAFQSCHNEYLPARSAGVRPVAARNPVAVLALTL